MYATYFEEYQKQLAEWQKQFLGTWMNSVTSGKPAFEFPDSVSKSIELQEQLVRSYLESQETAAKMALENQKKFWEGYFDLARQSLAAVTKTA